MRQLGNIVTGLLAVCLSPLIIVYWIIFPCVGACVGIYQWRKRGSLLKRAIPDLLCSIDTDCPPGYVCLDGQCVPESA